MKVASKWTGELKIGRIILLGGVFLVAAIVAGALRQTAIAGFCGVAGVGAVIYQIKSARDEKADIERKIQLYRAAESAGFTGVSIADFIDGLERLDSETILNYERVQAMGQEGTAADVIAASAEVSRPLPPKDNGRFRRAFL
jgi:hypothetical protein